MTKTNSLIPKAPPAHPHAAFLAALDWKIPILWPSSQGIHKIDDNRRAVIYIDTQGYADHYPGAWVKIVGKQDGHITGQYFHFHDYIKETMDGGNPHGKDQKLHAWIETSRGASRPRHAIDWYILRPKDKAATRPFCEAVETYIDQWR